jgi:hypothetical protein
MSMEKNPVIRRMGGDQLGKVLHSESKITLEKQIEDAKLKMRTLFDGPRGENLKKLAEEYYSRHDEEISPILEQSKEALEKEVGEYGTAGEFVVACQLIDKFKRDKENAKWEKYS